MCERLKQAVLKTTRFWQEGERELALLVEDVHHAIQRSKK
jgi:hypothetical protein